MEDVPSSAGISCVSRHYPILGKIEDPHLPGRYVNQWYCGEGQGHAANTTTTQSLEGRRRADVMPEKEGLKIF
jgi:hypothetical protein